jgi:gamma-glutamyl-gamma-aminobutyrate hydrolase PuuD
MNKIVGVTARCVLSGGDAQEPRDCLSHDWLILLCELGITPVIIPNCLQDPVQFIRTTGIDRLLLSSGNNLQPLPGEIDTFDDFFPQRDHTETVLLTYAQKHKMPTLGVCRGMQMINRFFGGQLCRNLSELSGTPKPHVTKSHITKIITPEMKALIGPTIDVNSYHDQGITLTQIAPPLKVFATCEDDVAEGLYHPHLPVLAIMWHPERPHASSKASFNLFQYWLSLKTS